MPSYTVLTHLRIALLIAASISSLILLLWTRQHHPSDYEHLPDGIPNPATARDMSYDSSYLSLVEPLVYGARMPRLAARTVDTGASTSTDSVPRSDSANDGHPAVNPAIPALLAVAVFVVCTVVVLRGIRARGGSSVTPVYRKPVEEEKPRMWEVHLGRPPSPACMYAGEGWDRVMPVSLEYLPPYESPCPSPRGASPVRPPLRAFPTRTSRSLSRDSPRSSWSTFPEKRTASPDAPAAEDPARMRVAVLIAMPSPSSSPATTPSSSGAPPAPAAPAPAYLGLAEV